ncbi:hypothetical protein BU26DRAFT_44044 [Trematosphaeria pertusa]|uniref:Uncharacterized protein n=1 Tax=Trematosphaeria pertusa TaxID=390896 RepID=A0A6A6J7M5_9PLEO|nr:uncharacterized protein BU26DRAFT_44044 [Trematosphaeria pertusa]KAF2257453.1 hypothetical protein BU26DRAFT_44044 [Trematosphaeria pertusa]
MPTEYECHNRRCSQLTFYDIDKWAFRSQAWKDCDFEHVQLTKIHRQSDEKFISILQQIRIGMYALVLKHRYSDRRHSRSPPVTIRGSLI